MGFVSPLAYFLIVTLSIIYQGRCSNVFGGFLCKFNKFFLKKLVYFAVFEHVNLIASSGRKRKSCRYRLQVNYFGFYLI